MPPNEQMANSSMKIAVIGAGAMGSVIGGRLAAAGHDVTLVDVAQPIVDAITAHGLRVHRKNGDVERIAIRATTRPGTVGVVDLLLIFVKCYHTEAAVAAAAPLIGPATRILSLQNGWGNGPRIAQVVGRGRVLLGVCYHSANVIGPGEVRHGGEGLTHIGGWDGSDSGALDETAGAFNAAGLETRIAPEILKEIWSKLALNVCTLPTSALLRLEANQLLLSPELVGLMEQLLRETVSVAQASGIALDYDERWAAITGLLRRCGPGAKSSMLQDVEAARRTEIDVINQAIVDGGQKLKIATPYNESMVMLIKALEASFRRR